VAARAPTHPGAAREPGSSWPLSVPIRRADGSLRMATTTAPIDPMRFEADCAQATFETARPAFATLAIVFLVLAPINALTMRGAAHVWCPLHDLFLAALFTALRRMVSRMDEASPRSTILVVAVPLAIVSNTILSAALGGTTMPQVFVAMLLIGVGGMLLVTRWLIAATTATLVVWIAAAIPIAPSWYAAGEDVMVAVGAAALATIIHSLRRHAVRRLAQLRAHDVLRQEALETALIAAQDARVSLDRKVAERTEELARARDAIAAELADRKASDERRRALERTLAEAQRMEAVGRLAGGVAHDFNNLLMVIGGNVELLLEHGKLAVDERADLRDVMAAVERASRLIRQLLAHGRRQVMQTRRTTLTGLIDSVRRMVERVVGADIRLVIEASVELPIVADQAQLEQVVMNLVLNARDAMPGGGTLTLRTRRRELDDPIAAGHADAAPGAYAVLEVIDDGTGIDARVRESLFEPFFTTKSASQGSGLGLAAVGGIVAQHGGFVEVDSTPGQGSTFAVHLPITLSSADRTGPVTIPEGRGVGCETVLVVEDEPALRRLATDGLARLGYRVISAPDADAALRALESTTSPIDIMVTDVIMPGIDGVQLAEQVRARWPATRVLFVSGYAGDRLEARGLVEDDKLLLHKPFTLRQLGNRVRDLLDVT